MKTTDAEIVGPLVTIVFLVAGGVFAAYVAGRQHLPEQRSPSDARVHCESVCEGAEGYLAEMDVTNDGLTTCICLFGVDTE